MSALKEQGSSIVRMVHGPAKGPDQIHWSPSEAVAPESVSGFDAVVHLAGESIVGRWTETKKQKIRDSRVLGTRHLAEALAKTSVKPRAFVVGSAIGYYGNRGDEVLTETSSPGNEFLCSVCVEWEEATRPASEQGIRTVNPRFGIILDAHGGALAKMLTPFRMGIGGRVGDGKQWMSWIALEDVVNGLKFLLEDATARGPVNFVAPNPVTNAEFTSTLGRVLSRPTFFPIPAFGARLAFGEMADALLLSSQRVDPAVLEDKGFPFYWPTLEPALRYLLERKDPNDQ